MRAPVSTELMEPEITNVLTITCRTAVFLFALLSVSAAAQAPAGGVTQIDAVLASPDRFKVLLENRHAPA